MDNLETEEAVFLYYLPLLKRWSGRFALISGQRLVGVFTTRKFAEIAASSLLATSVFLIREIPAADPSDDGLPVIGFGVPGRPRPSLPS